MLSSHADEFEQSWRPIMNDRLAQLSSPDEVAAAQLQDEHWRWREKQDSRKNSLSWESFIVECDGEAGQQEAYDILTEKGFSCRISTY